MDGGGKIYITQRGPSPKKSETELNNEKLDMRSSPDTGFVLSYMDLFLFSWDLSSLASPVSSYWRYLGREGEGGM